MGSPKKGKQNMELWKERNYKINGQGMGQQGKEGKQRMDKITIIHF